MAADQRSQWAMDVVLVCRVDPPSEVLRKTVDETCGEGCPIGSDDGQPVITIEGEAADPASAVEMLNRKAQQLVDHLTPYECAIELTSRLEDRSAPEEAPQAGSLGES